MTIHSKATVQGISLSALVASLTTPVLAQGTESADLLSDAEVIMVTATRRAQSILDAPVSVSAFTGEGLRNNQVFNIEKLSLLAPNLKINKNQTTANSAQIYMRGVGQDDSTPVNEPGVAIYLDDVYIARTQGGLFDLLDVERVEVLRGPQGTLYGRNSSGGAIKLVSRPAPLDEFRAIGDVTIGSFDRLDIRGAVGTPIIKDVLGFKIEALSFDRDGFVTRRSDGADVNRVDRQTIRASLLYAPTEELSIDISADYTRDRSGEQSPIPLAPGTGLPGGRQPLFGFYTTDSNVPDLNDYDGYGVSARLQYSAGAFDFKSVTAYRAFDNVFWSDLRGRSPETGGGLDLFRDLEQSQFSQEFQFISTSDGPFSFVGGLYFLREDISNRDEFLVLHDYSQDTNSYAAYGEVTYDITEQFSITAGGRYTYDEKEFSIDAAGFNGPFSVEGAQESWDRFTPKVLLSYKPSEETLVYASWQEGFKAGAFQGFPQAAADVTDQTLAPEIVSAFEVGVKSSFLDQRLRVSLAGYYQDYKDLQIAVFRLIPETSLFAFQSANAQAEMWGIEFEFAADINDYLTINGNLGTFSGDYTDADPRVLAQVGIDQGAMKFMPDVSANLGITYTYPVSDFGNFIANANLAYTSQVFFSTEIIESNSQDGHELVDLRVGFESADGRWSLFLSGENITDQEWAATGTAAADGSLFVSPPATWSLTFGTRF
jgi:iron complex outermembrane receptor protein